MHFEFLPKPHKKNLDKNSTYLNISKALFRAKFVLVMLFQ